MITVVKPGLLTTVQDEGRPGYRAFGMPVAGAMDRRAYRISNLLAGNAPGAAALEMTLLGGTFRFERETSVALAGADMKPTLDGEPVRAWSAFPVEAGSELALGAAVSGCRTYLAVRGGIAVPQVMGSRSTYTRAQVGGLDGRPLRAGDVLPVGAAGGSGRRNTAGVLPRDLLPVYGGEVRLRVLLGPQDDLFAPEGLATFLGTPYAVTNRNDRMGYQLEGLAIRHARGPDIVRDALLPGAVQVPGSAMPIVMTVDAQTVGGYAKIATVIGPDLGALAQARSGDTVRFVACSMDQAVDALREEQRVYERVAVSIGAAGRRAW